MPSTASATSWRGSASACCHDATGVRLTKPCSASTCAMRSREPSLHSAIMARLPAACSACTCLVTASNTFLLGSLRSAEKLWPARAAISIVSAVVGRRERRQPRQRDILQALAPFAFGEIEPVRRQRLVGRAGSGLIERLFARLVIVGDLREALVGGFFGQRLDGDGRCAEIVEQRFQALVEQRQPMLHAGVPPALADRFVEHVVGRRGAEGCDITGAEQPDGVRGELKLGHGHEIERAQVGIGALGFRIKAADRFQAVAEKIEPHRVAHAGREQIDDAAAHRVVAGLAHRRGAIEAIQFKPMRDAAHRQHVARRRRQRLLADDGARRHPLQDRIHGGEQHGRAFAAFHAGEPRERGHALRHDRGVRRHPVVRQAIPGREFQDLDVGGEEAERARQHRHARAVAADHRRADGRRRSARRNGAGQVGDDQAFGAVGNAGERQRPAGL